MTTIKNAVDDLLNHPTMALDEAIDQHFAPGFRQRTNGVWDDRTAVAARIAGLREIVAHATITVLDEFTDRDRYAERHVIDLATVGGERIVQEVYVFAIRDTDGRFTRIEEATVTLPFPDEVSEWKSQVLRAAETGTARSHREPCG